MKRKIVSFLNKIKEKKDKNSKKIDVSPKNQLVRRGKLLDFLIGIKEFLEK